MMNNMGNPLSTTSGAREEVINSDLDSDLDSDPDTDTRSESQEKTEGQAALSPIDSATICNTI